MRDSVYLRLQRAYNHFNELYTVVQGFKATKPYKFATKIDPQTRELVYYWIEVDPVPDPVPVLAGDIIHNLRTCLEYLAWDLVEANGKTPGAHTGFPIYDDPAKFVSSHGGKVNGMGQEAIDLIKKIEPYKGGKGNLLWRLHELDIADKHHLLFTVFGTLVSRPGYDAVFDPTTKLIPIEAGREFFRDAPDSEIKKNIDWPAHITLYEKGVVEGEVLIVVLRTIANHVRHVIQEFGLWRMRT